MSILSIYLDKRQNHVRIEVQAKPKAEASSKRPRKWCRALFNNRSETWPRLGNELGVAQKCAAHGPDLETSWGSAQKCAT